MNIGRGAEGRLHVVKIINKNIRQCRIGKAVVYERGKEEKVNSLPKCNTCNRQKGNDPPPVK